MKILLDTCVWGGAKNALIEAGHDVIWSGDWETDPGDEEIMSMALLQNRILVTLDKDFGEMAIVRGLPHCGIIRLVGIAARTQSTICDAILKRYGLELTAGAIITASEKHIRIRPML